MKEYGAFLATLCMLLSGCFAFGGYAQVEAEKLGRGHCRQPGVIDVMITGFQHEPNATLSVRVENAHNDGIGSFVWFGIYGSNAEYASYKNGSSDKPGLSPLPPGENVTLTWQIPDFPPSPWQGFAISYVYTEGELRGGKPRDNPTNLKCSLEGDNAPWAFETRP